MGGDPWAELWSVVDNRPQLALLNSDDVHERIQQIAGNVRPLLHAPEPGTREQCVGEIQLAIVLLWSHCTKLYCEDTVDTGRAGEPLTVIDLAEAHRRGLRDTRSISLVGGRLALLSDAALEVTAQSPNTGESDAEARDLAGTLKVALTALQGQVSSYMAEHGQDPAEAALRLLGNHDSAGGAGRG